MPLHWSRPLWFIALPFLVMLWWRLRHPYYQNYSNWHKIIDSHLLPYLLTKQFKGNLRWPWIILGSVWLLGILALAGPSWQKHDVPLNQHNVASVIVLDLSNQILGTDLKPNRLARARYKIRDLLAHPEGELGLVTYAGDSYVASPLTEDHHTIAAFLNELDPSIMPAEGQNMSAGLLQAKSLLQQNGNHTGEIILISSADHISPKAFETANKLHSEGYHLSVLGIGSQTASPLKAADGSLMKDQQGHIILGKMDKPGLQKLAKIGGGLYVNFSNDNRDIERLKQMLLQKQQVAQQKNVRKQHILRWHDQGYILIWVLLPLVLFGFRHGLREKFIG